MVSASGVRIRTYQVGFGECILLTISYSRPLPDGRTERHVLFDFGTRAQAKGGPSLAELATRIAEHCDGHLDGVVVTHRHRDHVRGFGDAKAREILAPLAPGVMIRPWTDVTGALRGDESLGLGEESLGFLELVDGISEHGRSVDEQFAPDGRTLAKRARAIAELGAPDAQALAMLEDWTPADRTQWVRSGDDVDVSGILPGVRIEVLGPPTLEQVPRAMSYASSSAEYWLRMTEDDTIAPELLAPRDRDELAPAKQIVAAPQGLGRPSWLLDELHGQGPRQVLDIVEGFRDVLNNTSVVLLITVGRRTLLLGGDAQVENWSYALDSAYGENDRTKDAGLRRRLARVDLYKVGDHGSRNATPRRLVELWRNGRKPDHPLCSILSTLAGTYGSAAEGGVPRKALVGALRELGPLYSTEDLDPDVWWFDVEAATDAARAEFAYTAGPPQA